MRGKIFLFVLSCTEFLLTIKEESRDKGKRIQEIFTDKKIAIVLIDI